MALLTAGEWVRANWSYQPVSLSHTGSTLVKAFHSALTQAGWELAPWSGSGDDRYYLRVDRRSINLTNDAVGTAGNVAITKVGANITVAGMADGTVSVAATGSITLSDNPADGNTITINDGVNPAVTFEFESGGGVTGGNISVAIGTKLINTIDNLLAAINAQGFAITASLVSDMWRFNGDAVEQNCGIRVAWVSASVRVEISAFLENVAGTASQVETPTSLYSNNQKCLIVYNNSLTNDWTIYAGEDGLYYEAGTSGTPQNIAHGLIATFTYIPEFRATKDAMVKWTSQGISMDLFGSLKFSEDRNFRFVDNAGANKNYTGRLRPAVARGTNSVLASSQADARAYFIIPADNMISRAWGTSTENTQIYWAAFGILSSPIDDRYKLSDLWMIQHQTDIHAGVNSSSASNNVAPSGATAFYECRWFRLIKRIKVPDGSVLPYVNIVDEITGKTYRISRVADNGRNANLAIEYPATAISIPTTPSV